MMSNEATTNPFYDDAVGLYIATRTAEVFGDILSQLGVEGIREGRYRWVGTCPVHEGDKTNAFQLYIGQNEGDIPNWKCRTHRCESKLDEKGKPIWGNSVIGLVRAILTKHTDHRVTWDEACQWLCDFMGLDISSKTDFQVNYDKVRLTRMVQQMRPTQKVSEKTYPLNEVSKLKIPSPYFLKRGFSEDVLKRYCVGDWNHDPKDRMQNRAVVPIYDQDRKRIMGFTGRSLFERCPTCRLWHDQEKPCPQNDWEVMLGQKWLVSKDFNDKDYLYNYWFAKDHIQETNTAIIVEGPGDLWRLEEAGYHIGVAIFGVNLTPMQLFALESSGTLKLILLTDSDEAGSDCSTDLKRQCERLFNLTIPGLERKDIGETPIEEVRSILHPILEKP